MTKWYRKAIVGASLLMALMVAVAPTRLVHAQEPEPVKIRVEVNDSGFKPDTIEVQQGQMVEITFVWAHVGYFLEEHIMVLEGYKLESDKINSEHREATIKFIADKPGDFTFKCDLDCEVHDYLQKGHLKVGRTGGGGTTSLTPTTLSLTPSDWITGGAPITLTTVLKDSRGAPISKAEVSFAVDAEFAGTKGKMELGKARTDANGMASLSFQPTLSASKQTITARFDGMGIYGESQQATEITQVGVPPSAYRMESIGLESLRHWAPTAFGLAILAIWSTFGFVLYRAFSISRVRSKTKGRVA